MKDYFYAIKTVLIIVNLSFSTSPFAFSDIYTSQQKVTPSETEKNDSTDSTITVIGTGATTITSNSDGTKIIKDHYTGRSLEQDSDGYQIIKNPDGTILKNYTDGKQIVVNYDGSSVSNFPDGTKTTIKSDGTLIQKNADGEQTIKYSNGETIKLKTDDRK